MKFRGTKAALAVLVSGALMLGACTSGEDPDAENSSPRSTGYEITVTGSLSLIEIGRASCRERV